MVSEIIKSHGLKITKQRLKVLSIIISMEENATINNIINNTSFDKSTVYRIINTFIDKKIIVKDINYNNMDYFIINDKHKHYIKCVKCHKIKILDNCPIDNITVKGFEVLNHSLRIDGICKECN